MVTLYRKYRPQKFGEAVGQNHIKLTLQHEISAGKVSHAYLFCGPRAVGKTTFARLLAKAVNCQTRKEGEHEPCDKCSSCEEIVATRSLDIIEIDAASNTGVDNVRENIIASARLAPSKEKFKVFIIDEVHMLSISAFNALLKILEEPPARIIFILCTTETHKVPATIISRCERFDFKRIGTEDLVKKLSHIVHSEGIKVGKNILESIARQSEGHMRDAESLLGQIVAISGKEITDAEADLVIPRSDIGEIISLLELLFKKDASSAISLINKLLDDGVDLEKFAEDFIELCRKVLISKINPALGEKLGLDIGESFEIKLNEVKKDLAQEDLVRFLEKFIIARREMKNSFILQLPLEMAVAELCFSTPTSVTAPASSIPPRPTITPVRQFSSPIVEEKTGDAPLAVIEEPISTPIANVSIDLETIVKKWSEVLAKIKKYNHSLSFVLRVCKPRTASSGKVCLAFKYKLHKDRIDEGKMREIVMNVFKEVYGAPLVLETIIDESLEMEENNAGNSVAQNIPTTVIEEKVADENIKGGDSSDDMMSGLLKTFGGKIIS
ncbi:MAG: DNA polymerase III subunit gamma/tau [Patescibacteria group bacterium]|jgi:DNA polymerase-3 subunit gamma/tau